jgi:hypothetical protein
MRDANWNPSGNAKRIGYSGDVTSRNHQRFGMRASGSFAAGAGDVVGAGPWGPAPSGFAARRRAPGRGRPGGGPPSGFAAGRNSTPLFDNSTPLNLCEISVSGFQNYFLRGLTRHFCPSTPPLALSHPLWGETARKLQL